MKDKYFSAQLAALGEDSIKDNEGHTYRFSCFRSFHFPFAIRVDANASGGGLLTFAMCDAPLYPSGSDMNVAWTLDISEEQMSTLSQSIEQNGFWDMPVSIREYGLDGSNWIVECVRDGQYHVVERWTPREGEIFDIGSLFTSLSGERIHPLYSKSG